ncbi:hypothetical protein C8D87_11198 [Lentzea atacamensis]|uniref:DUF3592 domain-containing protein n=1 Tax=Lentzea atacamensis TaxID=531938 RepID=A0ABX9E0K6_9PSEU|nr:DUF6346 domain-containing protein [Lentzea atacamensis]RAS60679.1 hypothetical protein C8D87_11198 [Lentzea atacamensis]
MKALHRIVAFLLVPALGYLLGATIFNHFWDEVEPGDPAKAKLVAVAKSCERHGPVAPRGFGFYYRCQTEVRSQPSGNVTKWTVTGWLEPSDIGKEYAVHTARRGTELTPDVRSQVFLGWLSTFVFAIAFLFVFVKIAGPAMPEGRRKRRMPTRYEPPAT